MTVDGPLVWLQAGEPPHGGWRGSLVCVPPACATVAAFVDWREPLRERGIALAAVDWSGDGPADGVLDRAGRLAAAVRGLGGDWVLLGHSFGGLIAYETARALENLGVRPRRLVLCAARPGHLPEPDDPAELGDDAIVERLARIAGLDDRAVAHPALRQVLITRMRAEIAVARPYRHRHEHRLSCPSLVYGGEEDAVVPPELLARWTELLADSELTLRPGGHFFYREDVRGFLNRLLRDSGLTGSDRP